MLYITGLIVFMGIRVTPSCCSYIDVLASPNHYAHAGLVLPSTHGTDGIYHMFFKQSRMQAMPQASAAVKVYMHS